MSKVIIDKNKIDILANAISCKSGEPVTMTLDEMVSAVDGIDTGGGGITPTGNIDITGAGVTDVTNYATATVPSGEVYVSGGHSFFTSSGVRKWQYTPHAQIYLDDSLGTEGFVADGYIENGEQQIFNAIATGTSVTPTTSSQTIGGANYMMEGTVTVNPIPSSYVQPTSTVGATTYRASTSSQTIASGTYHSAAATIAAVSQTNLTADNIKSGTTISISNGQSNLWSVTGTYTGGGGDSKNVQINQSTTRTSTTTLSKANGDLTVSKTGTYDVYWTATRSATSTGYTWGSQLYVGGSAYGSENTTWSNHVQNNHLSNVSLTANQKIAVYTRGRSGSYYVYAPMLVIVEA